MDDDTSSTIYVGNLDYRTDEDTLKRCFRRVGAVIEARIARNGNGQSRGFGFVRFQTPDLAEQAIARFNGENVEGRILVVSHARQRRRKRRR